MRNLIEFPITADEVLTVVNTFLSREQERGEIGGINGLILHYVQQYLIDHPDAVRDIVDLTRV